MKYVVEVSTSTLMSPSDSNDKKMPISLQEEVIVLFVVHPNVVARADEERDEL